MPVSDLPRESQTDLGGVRARFRAAFTADQQWRTNALLDLKFRAGGDGERSYQWPDDIQTQRNLEGRPFLTINRIDPFLKQVENQARQANISIVVQPLKGDVSEAGAEARQGLIRHIRDLSDGETQDDMVFRYTLTMGRGWAQVYSEYDPLSDDPDAQEVKYRSIPDLFSVYTDPAALAPDRRDMRFAFVIEDLPREEYDLLYPDSGLSKRTYAESMIGDAAERAQWFPGGGVRVAYYYSVIEKYATKRGTRVRTVTGVKLQKINAFEVLEETTLPITRIPLVPEFGDEYRINGRVDHLGMVRNGRDPQRLFNFFATSLADQADQATDAAVIVAKRQIEGVEDFWTKKRLPYRVYNDTDSEGNPITAAPPERNSAPPPIQGTVEALQMADMYLKEVFSLFDPSMGQQKAQQSGRAVLALQQQGEIGNFNFLDSHKRYLRSLGQLLLEMAAAYYDTPRIRRIVGKDESPKDVLFHAGDENAPDAEDLGQYDINPDSIHDLTVGVYDVTVTTGPSAPSRRFEQLQHLLDFLKVFPQAAQLSGDVVAGLMELPQLKARLQKMLPPQFQQNPDQTEIQLSQAMQKLQALGQQHDAMVKELTAKNAYIQTDQAKWDAQKAIKSMEQQFQITLQQMKDATTIEVARINAAKQAADTVAEAAEERLALLATHVHEANEADLDRQHEIGKAQMDHAHAMAQLKAGAQNESQLSAQEHGQSLEQGDADTSNTMATQANQAALTPPEGNSAEA